MGHRKKKQSKQSTLVQQMQDNLANVAKPVVSKPKIEDIHQRINARVLHGEAKTFPKVEEEERIKYLDGPVRLGLAPGRKI